MRKLATKAFEIRDACTFIPVIATALLSDADEETYLLGRCGYRNDDISVMVTRLNDSRSANDPHDWTNRTMVVAHEYIREHFFMVETGSVVDVEFILGERTEWKVSERLEGVL